MFMAFFGASTSFEGCFFRFGFGLSCFLRMLKGTEEEDEEVSSRFLPNHSLAIVDVDESFKVEDECLSDFWV